MVTPEAREALLIRAASKAPGCMKVRKDQDLPLRESVQTSAIQNASQQNMNTTDILREVDVIMVIKGIVQSRDLYAEQVLKL